MLEFRNASASIAGVSILRDLDFTVRQGDTVALVGRNGAGKTTLLRAVMGFVDVKGAIAFDGYDITSMMPARRPALGIGYAPEDRRLFSAFTVEENIKLPAQVARLAAGEQARRMARAYDILPELREMAGRPAGNVSGGQGKMVALGRALMVGARLIMLDEPFQGLAPALAKRYSEALRALRDADREVTLIITESNPRLLDAFADRTFIIERGEVEERGADTRGNAA